MAEKVPSFKTGGAYWFVDLTTPDALYIFPVLTALTFLITVEVNVSIFINDFVLVVPTPKGPAGGLIGSFSFSYLKKYILFPLVWIGMGF